MTQMLILTAQPWGRLAAVAVRDQAPRTLHRAVSDAELQDWTTTGRLRASPSGMEGKHFTNTYDHAVRFGRMLQELDQDAGPSHILRVEFDEEADVRCYDELADRIGPGYFASDEALEHILDVTDCGLLPSDVE